MKITISTHKVGSSLHDAVHKRVKGIRKPTYWTIIKLRKPEDKQFSLESLAFVEAELTPMLDDQECTAIGEADSEGRKVIKSARLFWNAKGVLIGEASIHLLAHLTIGSIMRRKRKIMILHKKDNRKNVRVVERTYPVTENSDQMIIALSGKYHREALRHVIMRHHKTLVDHILSKGHSITPPENNGAPLEGEPSKEP